MGVAIEEVAAEVMVVPMVLYQNAKKVISSISHFGLNVAQLAQTSKLKLETSFLQNESKLKMRQKRMQVNLLQVSSLRHRAEIITCPRAERMSAVLAVFSCREIYRICLVDYIASCNQDENCCFEAHCTLAHLILYLNHLKVYK